MGVADNKSYKDQPYFKDLYPAKSGDYPSINGEKDINSTIKENPYRANVEIEGNEIVLQPDLSALFKAVGKKHSQGGMDVLLKPNSFIFSDDKTLAFNEDDHELLELKDGGNFNKSTNTPADVLKRNVNVKHYNTLISNLKDINQDYLAKNSSMKMMMKYIQTLGNIAYGQEAKKGFPDGLPDFSQGTAPVYNPSVKYQIDEQKQFAKYGGKINPYMQVGGYPFKTNTGAQYDNNQGYMTMVNGMPTWVPAKMMPGVKVKGKIPAQGNQQGKYSGVPPLSGVPPEDNFRISLPNFPDIYPSENPPQTSTQDRLQVPDVTGQEQPPIEANWQFTPWQKLSMLHNFGQYANAKRYMPYRSHYNASYVEPSLLNPEQAIQDAQAVSNQQVNNLRTLNPILRNAQAQGVTGQLLNQVPGIRTQYDNANSEITNRGRFANNQTKNMETGVNNQNDQQYYQQAVEGRKNFDNLRSYLGNQGFNEVMTDVQDNQTLAYNLLTRQNPAYGYDWKTGNFTRNKKDIRDTAGMTPQDTLDSMIDYAKKLKDLGLEPSVQSALVRGQFFKLLAPYLSQSSTPPPFKKGGRTKNPYRY